MIVNWDCIHQNTFQHLKAKLQAKGFPHENKQLQWTIPCERMIMQAWVATKDLVEITSLQAHKVAIKEKTFD